MQATLYNYVGVANYKSTEVFSSEIILVYSTVLRQRLGLAYELISL